LPPPCPGYRRYIWHRWRSESVPWASSHLHPPCLSPAVPTEHGSSGEQQRPVAMLPTRDPDPSTRLPPFRRPARKSAVDGAPDRLTTRSERPHREFLRRRVGRGAEESRPHYLHLVVANGYGGIRPGWADVAPTQRHHVSSAPRPRLSAASTFSSRTSRSNGFGKTPMPDRSSSGWWSCRSRIAAEQTMSGIGRVFGSSRSSSSSSPRRPCGCQAGSGPAAAPARTHMSGHPPCRSGPRTPRLPGASPA
jgi:hypothetical protein